MRNLVARPADAGIVVPSYRPLPDGALLRTHLRVGQELRLSGHTPGTVDSPAATGAVGADLSVADAAAAAREVALNLLATIEHAVGDLDRIERIVSLGGYVRSAPGFGDQPQVIDGASAVFAELWGPDRGIPVRFAIGVAELPFGVPVEIDLTVLIEAGA